MTRTADDLTTVRPLVEFLKYQREARGLTRYALATLIGCKESQVADWEEHRHAPGTTWLARLGAGLGFDLTFVPQEGQ